jgi:hypothetical protein
MNAKDETKSNLAISVCLPDGTREEIEHLSVDEARITLGMSSCPSGKANDKLVAAKEKASFSELGEMQNKAMRTGQTKPKHPTSGSETSTSALNGSFGPSVNTVSVETMPPMTIWPRPWISRTTYFAR